VRVLAAAALLAFVAAPAALADSATGEEVRRLAARAADGDETALVGLRRIDSVDGRPADLAAALDASPAALRARLRVLAAGAAVPPGAADPRGQAEEILAERRFHGSSVPRPLHGVLEWLGQKLRFFARPFDWLAGLVPGGSTTLWIALSALVVAAAVLVANRLAARRGGRLVERSAAGRRGRAPDPGRLEGEADEAERRGDLARALRLRFRAGLIRLAGLEAIPPRESLTSGQLRRLLRSESFDHLAGDLDEVVYGGRAAAAADVERARAAWPRVVEEAGQR
jgi:ABC-type amino acid transport substrate-binding protein